MMWRLKPRNTTFGYVAPQERLSLEEKQYAFRRHTDLTKFQSHCVFVVVYCYARKLFLAWLW